MEAKKNPDLRLDRKSVLFFNIGLVISLLLVILAFEWKTYEKVTIVELKEKTEVDDQIVPVTEIPEPQPPKPKVMVREFIETVEEEPEMPDVEIVIDQDEVIEFEVPEFTTDEVEEEVAALMKRTKESLYIGIEMAVAGNRVGDIGHAVQKHVEKVGYSVVRDLVGHGLGRNLHEKPEVPNYGKRGSGIKLQEGMVLAIEPMVNLGTRHVIQLEDGWTIRTADMKPSAHFEHDVVVRKGKAEVLSTFKFIEEVINAKLYYG